jgi:hypothetical protein
LGFSSAQADLLVTELFTVDPGWKAGGYWEFTVTNMTAGDVYMIAVGNVGADLIAVRYPDVAGVWQPLTLDQDTWDTNEWGRYPTDWTTPDTSLYPFAVEFPGATQALVYYVLGSNPPLGVGNVLSGLYFNYPFSGADDGRAVASSGGSNVIAFNSAGEVIARGITTGAPLSTTSTTWGAVKALYR